MTKSPRINGRHRRGHIRPPRGERRASSGRVRARRRPDLAGRGQIFGIVALILILVTVVVLAAIGQPWLAGTVTASLLRVVGLFVTGRFPTRANTGTESDVEPEAEPPP